MSALPCLHDYDKDHKILHSQSCFPLVKTFVEMKQRLSTCFDYFFEPKSSDIFVKCELRRECVSEILVLTLSIVVIKLIVWL